MPTEAVVPSSVLASSNYTAPTVADIDDDPNSPDGLWLVGVDDGTDTDLRVEMGDPSNTLTAAATQTVAVLVRKFATGGNDPTVTVELWESGAFVATLVGATTVTSETGAVVSGTFTDATIGNPNNVEVRVLGSRSGGSPSSRRSVEVGAIRWTADVQAAATAPGAPTGLAATPGNGQVGLSWAAPASDGGAAITDYLIEYNPAAAGWSTFADGVSTATTSTVTGLTNDVSHDFRVSAINTAGTGTPSATATATPTAPTGTGWAVEIATGPTTTVAATFEIATGPSATVPATVEIN